MKNNSQQKKKAGRKSKFKDEVKTAMIYNTEVPEKELKAIKDFISLRCAPYLR